MVPPELRAEVQQLVSLSVGPNASPQEALEGLQSMANLHPEVRDVWEQWAILAYRLGNAESVKPILARLSDPSDKVFVLNHVMCSSNDFERRGHFGSMVAMWDWLSERLEEGGPDADGNDWTQITRGPMRGMAEKFHLEQTRALEQHGGDYQPPTNG